MKETEEAVKAYEQGIADGSLSALARQYGDGIVNLTVGNIRPKEKVTKRVVSLGCETAQFAHAPAVAVGETSAGEGIQGFNRILKAGQISRLSPARN